MSTQYTVHRIFVHKGLKVQKVQFYLMIRGQCTGGRDCFALSLPPAL